MRPVGRKGAFVQTATTACVAERCFKDTITFSQSQPSIYDRVWALFGSAFCSLHSLSCGYADPSYQNAQPIRTTVSNQITTLFYG